METTQRGNECILPNKNAGKNIISAKGTEQSYDFDELRDYSAVFPYMYKPLEVKNFDDISVSTRTALANLETEVDLRLFFLHADIKQINQPEIKRKKIKIKQVEAPGSILSMCYSGEYKGIQTRQDPKPFLNQTSFVMSLDKTNVNFKLFNNGVIQATGCKTKQHEFDIIRFIVEHGKAIERKKDIVIFKSEPCLTNTRTVMINVDFKLGFNIDRKALNTHIYGLNGFESTFDENLTNSGVSVKIARPNDDPDAEKKYDSFICFHTGTVLLSGNDLDRMRELYYKFYETIDSIKNLIVTSPRSIRLQKRRLRIRLEEEEAKRKADYAARVDLGDQAECRHCIPNGFIEPRKGECDWCGEKFRDGT